MARIGKYVIAEAPQRRRANLNGVAALWRLVEVTSEDPARAIHVSGGIWSEGRTDPAQVFSAFCERDHSWEIPDDGAALTTPEVETLPPLTLIAADSCDNVGPAGISQVRQRAVASLAADESYAIETTLATGNDETGAAVWDAVSNEEGALWFEDGASVTTVGAAADPTLAIAELEEAYYDAERALGTLHVPHSLFMILHRNGLIERASTSGNWRTAGGSYVAGGFGYTGNQPNGNAPAAGTAWANMTGDVHVWRNEVETQDFHQYDLNRHIVSAQRSYVIGFGGSTMLAKPINLVVEG